MNDVSNPPRSKEFSVTWFLLCLGLEDFYLCLDLFFFFSTWGHKTSTAWTQMQILGYCKPDSRKTTGSFAHRANPRIFRGSGALVP